MLLMVGVMVGFLVVTDVLEKSDSLSIKIGTIDAVYMYTLEWEGQASSFNVYETSGETTAKVNIYNLVMDSHNLRGTFNTTFDFDAVKVEDPEHTKYVSFNGYSINVALVDRGLKLKVNPGGAILSDTGDYAVDNIAESIIYGNRLSKEYAQDMFLDLC